MLNLPTSHPLCISLSSNPTLATVSNTQQNAPKMQNQPPGRPHRRARERRGGSTLNIARNPRGTPEAAGATKGLARIAWHIPYDDRADAEIDDVDGQGGGVG